MDTIYLQDLSKQAIDSMYVNKDILGLNTDYFLMDESYKSDYPKQYKNTWNYPNVKKGVILDDTRKASMSIKKDSKGNYYADVFDVIDYGGTTGRQGSKLDKEVNA
jgi:hypothetical protein